MSFNAIYDPKTFSWLFCGLILQEIFSVYGENELFLRKPNSIVGGEKRRRQATCLKKEEK